MSPHNIIVTYDGTVRLTDFGVAKALNQSLTETLSRTLVTSLTTMLVLLALFTYFFLKSRVGIAMRAVAEQMALDSEERYIDPFTVASRFALAGETDRAFAWLDKALERGSLEMTYLSLRPDFDALRTDERFADLLRRLALPEQPADE